MALMRSRRVRPSNTVIVGAGVAGRIVLEEIRKRSDLNYIVRGFVDDNPALQGTKVEGLPVLGLTRDLSQLTAELLLEDAIIAMPSVDGQSVRKVADLCRRAGLETQIVPGVVDVLTGRANVSAARPVSVEDLLRRDTVVLTDDVRDLFHGKTVLVTGAAGSIGSELCRILVDLGTGQLVAFDIDENGVFELELELGSRSPRAEVVPVVGSILSPAKVDWIFETYRPAVVFHAAARKHVPLMESHPEEAVETNIVGTKNVAERALAHRVETFVHISTDKAVEPTSVMGASKRVSELLLQEFATRSRSTRFLTVRFGNVIGSRGSVLDVFRRQLAAGGPITVTDPEMTRYFMSVNEAAVLLLQSVVIGKSGDLLLLDMGEPVRLADLLHDLITLSGYASEDDVEIKSIGPRPGEKVHEKLHTESESLTKTKHPRILRVEREDRTPDLHEIDSLLDRARRMERKELREILFRMAGGTMGAGR
ncbi:MAG TPA: nucleoside-diphosphate sugar epimerase/dehydratase [Thermoplasmata archaeon]|nr:nucleoside-diphosphate sugar epimerase/dehydratase [Thermoplasmata archaeon]